MVKGMLASFHCRYPKICAEKSTRSNTIHCHRNGVAPSDVILENSKYDPSVALCLGRDLMTSRKEHMQIPQHLLGESYSWGGVVDIVADIYSGVGIYIELINIDLLTDPCDSSCFGLS